MRIVILTQFYPPETGAPQSRLSDLARRLAAHGHEITVVTGMPNYPTGAIFPEWRGKAVAAERTGSARVLRSWLYASPRATTARQLATYFSFAASSALTAPLRLRRADIVLWESPPLFLAPTARLLSLRLGAKLVMNVSDLWPESAVALGLLRNRRLARALERWEAWAYRSADLVTFQTEGIGSGVERRLPGTPKMLFPNGVDTATMRRVQPRPGLRQELGLPDGGPVVGYVGNLGRAQAVEQLVDAAAILQQAGNPASVLVIGDGPRRSELLARIESQAVANIQMLPPRPHADIPEILSLLDVAVVPLADAPLFDGARPSKMFELLAVGVPFVYCGRGEGARLAEESGASVVVEPENPPALAHAIRQLLAAPPDERAEMGRKGREYVVASFDRARIADALEARLRLVAKGQFVHHEL